MQEVRGKRDMMRSQEAAWSRDHLFTDFRTMTKTQ